MCLENIIHAISVARLVMERTPHIILAGEGALQFALANGFKKENLLTPESEKAWKERMKTANYHPEINIENKLYKKNQDLMPGGPSNHDTIGMMAMDVNGNLKTGHALPVASLIRCMGALATRLLLAPVYMLIMKSAPLLLPALVRK